MNNIPWSILSVPIKDLEKANDLGAEGWQPFAVSGEHLFLRRMGTTLKRVKIPVCCGTCEFFKEIGKRPEEEVTLGNCKKHFYVTTETHCCNDYQSMYV